MPLNSSSFFAGVATVIVTIGVGFGAGVFLTDAFVGSDTTNTGRFAQRAAARWSAQPQVPAAAVAGSEGVLPTQAAPEQSSRQVTPVRRAAAPDTARGTALHDAPPTAHIADAQAKAGDGELEREAKRQEQQIKRDERRRAERKRREARRQAARARQENAARIAPAAGDDYSRGPQVIVRDAVPTGQVFLRD